MSDRELFFTLWACFAAVLVPGTLGLVGWLQRRGRVDLTARLDPPIPAPDTPGRRRAPLFPPRRWR